MEILVCSVCEHYPLKLAISHENQEGEIVEGMLTCEACGHEYAIRDEIPIMTPITPICRFCGEETDAATWDDQSQHTADQSLFHCTRQEIAVQKAIARLKLGRREDDEITEVSLERGISRDAARKWIARHASN